MARSSNKPKKIKENVSKEAAQIQPAQVESANPTSDHPSGLGKGLWGIVGSKTRYGTVTQFSGLEYVRYEYRRIPEEFRDAAMNNTFLDVIEITHEPVTEVTEETAETEEAVEADALETNPDDDLSDLKSEPNPDEDEG